MVFNCLAQQSKSPKQQEDLEAKNTGKHKKVINEAFRAQYSLVRMLAQRNKWGLSKTLIWVQDYVFYFYCFDYPVLSLTWLLGIEKYGITEIVW